MGVLLGWCLWSVDDIELVFMVIGCVDRLVFMVIGCVDRLVFMVSGRLISCPSFRYPILYACKWVVLYNKNVLLTLELSPVRTKLRKKTFLIHSFLTCTISPANADHSRANSY